METPKIMLSDVWYTRMKWFVSIVLPAFGSLYFGLAQSFDWVNGEQVLGVIALGTTFLGTVLGISSKNYNKTSHGDGEIVVTPQEDGPPAFSLRLEKTPEELQEMKTISFDVIEG